MIRFAFGAITGMILAYIIGIGVETVEQRQFHQTHRRRLKPLADDVMANAYR